MNYGNPSISIPPLSEWKSIKINCGDGTRTIPNDDMLRELIIMPVPDLILITNILRQYGATEKQEKEVREMLKYTDYEKDDWLLNIVNKLVKENSDSKLIVRLSLENYRLHQPSDPDSQSYFKEMSDWAIENIRTEDKIPSKIDRIIKNFLDEKEISNRKFLDSLSFIDTIGYVFNYFFGNGEDLSQISYTRFRYHKLVLNYFDDVIPFRITHLSNVDKDREFIYFLQELYQQMMNADNEKIPNTTRTFTKKQQEYHERINESCRRKMVLFTDYYKAKLYLTNVYQLLAQECPEFIKTQIEWDDRVRRSNERNFDNKNLERQMLCLCEFCYRLRWFKKVKGGAVAWHCKEPECENRYRAWSKYLWSKDIEITSYLP